MNKTSLKLGATVIAAIMITGLIYANFNTGIVAQSRNGFGG